MKILILDDCEFRHAAFTEKFGKPGYELTHVRTAQEAINRLKAGGFDVVFLDHDLGGQVFVASGAGTGYEVADWLAKNEAQKPAVVVIHTLNPAGQDAMKKALPDAALWPFAWMPDDPKVLSVSACPQPSSTAN